MRTSVNERADLPARLATIRGPASFGRFLRALGFEALDEVVPRPAWSTYGLADAPGLRGIRIAGRADSLDVLVLEVATGPDPELAAALARRVRARNPARLAVLVAAGPGYRRLILGTFAGDRDFRHIVLNTDDVHPAEVEALEEMVPEPGATGLERTLLIARALDRSRVTRRFFLAFRARRDAVSAAWSGIPASAARERAQLSLLFLSRLTFLYFLQKRGALAGEPRYLVRLFGAWRDATVEDGTFYRRRIVPLFFGALNRRREDRSPDALQLGDLPYLNGGLFEPHALEWRYPELDLGDEEVGACFDQLLERYRFATREGDDGAYGVDPEVLGRVFEELMAGEKRSSTGSFYTPAPVVRRVVREAVTSYVAGACGVEAAARVADGRGAELDPSTRHRARRALDRIRVLDPACGSGAFLLGALDRLAVALGGLEQDGRKGAAEASGHPASSSTSVRHRIVARSLHGVDLLDDAALLCSLRLWLALTAGDEGIRPLPNLDRRIRQGDALVDPLDLASLDLPLATDSRWHPLGDPDVRRALRAVGPASQRYLHSTATDRGRLQAQLQRSETHLARRWLDAARRVCDGWIRELEIRARGTDLFGDVTADAKRARRALGAARNRQEELKRIGTALEEEDALPFFSFGVHFSEASAGFDLILSNPPWVRAHRWPQRIRTLCHRFEVCRSPAWSGAARLTGAAAGAGAQVDLSLLFLERSLRLLAPGGVLAILIPAKALRAVYAGAARSILLRDLEITCIEDHALDQRSMFRADAFAAVLVGRKRGEPRPSAPGSGAGKPSAVRIRQIRRGVDPLEFSVPATQLSLDPSDPASPWIIAPPEVVSVMRAMQAVGPALGSHPGLRVRRGIMTGANRVLVLSSARPRLGALTEIETEGGQEAIVETSAVRPLVRGAGIDAFRYRTDSYVLWSHGADAGPVPAPRRAGRYLERHREVLEGRSGWKPGLPIGAVFRLYPETLGPKVAWHDLSDTLRAVALPARVPFDGREVELVPLNTVYFLPTPDPARARLLAGILNSLPARVFVRALAERAKDSRFRFFAWTVSTLPLPRCWETHPSIAEVGPISDRAHAGGGIEPGAQRALDAAVGRLYGLSERELSSLHMYDAWLRGEP